MLGSTFTRISFALLLLMLLNGCGAAATPGLAGTQWKLTAFAKAGVTQPSVPGNEPTLSFGADGSISGTAGCNTFGGSYTAKGQQLSIKDMLQTLMACADPAVMAQEQQYSAALGSAQSFTLENTRLTVTTAEGVLVFAQVN